MNTTISNKRSRRRMTTFQRFVWTVLLVTVLISVPVVWMVFSFAKSLDNTALSSLSSTTLDPATSTTTSTSAALSSGTVCTNVPEGRLHVRIAPGEGTAEAGYLTEGEAVTISATPTQIAPDGGKWIELLSPLSGWVNTNYICPLGTKASASTPNTNASANGVQK